MYFIQFEKHQLHTILRVKDHYLQNGHELFVDSALNIFLVATNAQDYNVNQTKISTISKKKKGTNIRQYHKNTGDLGTN